MVFLLQFQAMNVSIITSAGVFGEYNVGRRTLRCVGRHNRNCLLLGGKKGRGIKNIFLFLPPPPPTWTILFRRERSDNSMLSQPDTHWTTTNKMTFTAPVTVTQTKRQGYVWGTWGSVGLRFIVNMVSLQQSIAPAHLCLRSQIHKCLINYSAMTIVSNDIRICSHDPSSSSVQNVKCRLQCTNYQLIQTLLLVSLKLTSVGWRRTVEYANYY